MEFSLSPEQAAFKKSVYDFARREIARPEEIREADRASHFRFEAWQKMGGFGLLGLPFPESYGGASASCLTTVVGMEAFGRGCEDAGLCLSWGAHMILCGVPVWLLGTDAQKEKYLPPLASGETIGGFALSEPDSGSDAAGLKTRAVKRGGVYSLTGTKMWTTNGPQGGLFVVMAVTDSARQARGISAFLVERKMPGFSVSRELDKLGHRTSPTAELVFQDCEVPAENLLGKEGEGFTQVAQTILEWERACLLAPTVGMIHSCLDHCVKYASQRKQFGFPIAHFQAIQFKLADMKVALEAARLLVYRVAALKDAGVSAMREACVAKLFVSEMAVRTAEEGVQLHGGYGYIKEFPVERMYRDAKLLTIGAGTSEVQKMVIARSLLGLKKEDVIF